MKRAIVLVAAAALFFAGESQALEVVDTTLVPSWYGTVVVTKDKDGKEVRTVVFNRQAFALSHKDLGEVLKAYGLTIVDETKAPRVVQAVKSKDQDGKEVVKYVYLRPDSHGFAPTTTDALLKAHGVSVVDGTRLPPAYGREVTQKDKDGKDVKVVILNQSAYAMSPAEWNRILSAYGR